jgi:hypothetical protein
MAKAKRERNKKSQLGQFLTPAELSEKIVNEYTFKIDDKILEPSFGKGSFLFPIIDKLLELHNSSTSVALDYIFENNLYGVEYDERFFNAFVQEVKEKYNHEVKNHNLKNNDFFKESYEIEFDWIIGNPPFGGTFDTELEDELDKKYGRRHDEKIKKETYSFFIVSCVERLKEEGKLIFICSDTFLTINTMKGLRNFLIKSGHNKIHNLDKFSDETQYGMVVLEHTRPEDNLFFVDDKKYEVRDVYKFPNISFSPENIKYFDGEKIGEYFFCTSGMTVGKNEYFIKKIEDGKITEKYEYSFFEEPITLEKEIQKARLNTLSSAKKNEIRIKEIEGQTQRNIKITKREIPEVLQIPHKDYCYYNKSNSKELYQKPTHVVYWKNEGDAVCTFKKSGNWYLHGVGGQPHFGKAGFTWSLISTKIKPRYLPEGYVFDSGAPVGVLRDGVDCDEIYFVIGWLYTKKATDILKSSLNHTRNIQSKDIERMPYPFWVSAENKEKAIRVVKENIENIKADQPVQEGFDDAVETLYEFPHTKKSK